MHQIWWRVYPRTHGGTSLVRQVRKWVAGLSPHTRGNQDLPPAPHGWRRSIPAHTGEPPRGSTKSRSNRVYPRTHGGTDYPIVDLVPIAGLSPHTRGNQGRHLPAGVRFGSIPAHTGEPPRSGSPWSPSGVYPRTHGGTAFPLDSGHGPPGLSPHTRGNPAARTAPVCALRSIPAHTGEPLPPCAPSMDMKVYPRTHGGTRGPRIRRPTPPGLSPHTRGNLYAAGAQLAIGRSIPAHTGEPGRIPG